VFALFIFIIAFNDLGTKVFFLDKLVVSLVKNRMNILISLVFSREIENVLQEKGIKNFEIIINFLAFAFFWIKKKFICE